jgi:hypothetical protein
MSSSTDATVRGALCALALSAVTLLCSGCAVVAVVGTAASLATDVAVGAVKITGSAIGGAVNAVAPGGEK